MTMTIDQDNSFSSVWGCFILSLIQNSGVVLYCAIFEIVKQIFLDVIWYLNFYYLIVIIVTWTLNDIINYKKSYSNGKNLLVKWDFLVNILFAILLNWLLLIIFWTILLVFAIWWVIFTTVNWAWWHSYIFNHLNNFWQKSLTFDRFTNSGHTVFWRCGAIALENNAEVKFFILVHFLSVMFTYSKLIVTSTSRLACWLQFPLSLFVEVWNLPHLNLNFLWVM